MDMKDTIRAATPDDAPAIHAVLRSNAGDPSLFQQPLGQIRRTIAEFTVAVGADGRVLGCAALRRHGPWAEILAVAVRSDAHGVGVGSSLIRELVGVLLHKLRLVLQQPIRRWLPAIMGRHVFMVLG
jgi:N-acetylglutamate synthase-like GNAT family acetyltransferase